MRSGSNRTSPRRLLPARKDEGVQRQPIFGRDGGGLRKKKGKWRRDMQIGRARVHRVASVGDLGGD
jgi:hypothetical protein